MDLAPPGGDSSKVGHRIELGRDHFAIMFLEQKHHAMNRSALLAFLATNLMVSFFTVYYLVKVLRSRGYSSPAEPEAPGDQKN